MGHDHAHPTGHRGKLATVLAMSLLVFVLQLVVGLIAGSLALLSDAVHVLSDSAGLLMALVASTIAQAPSSDRRTFGLHRSEVLAAGANGLMLLGMCIGIVISAVGRLADPPRIDAPLVLGAGLVGLLVNIIGLFLLRSGAEENINVKGAYMEVLGDALGSVAVLVSASAILIGGWNILDPIASLVIAALILPRALALLREVVDVLLQASPRGMDIDELRQHITGVDGVMDVHDLHVWTLTSQLPVMSAHVVVGPEVVTMSHAHEILDRLDECLSNHFDIRHSTFQFEPAEHEESEAKTHG
ncbi:MAG: cation transporter [Aeromicrobium sp.]|nr:MAG: cation transporter [Aeromicrobium sp.]